MEQCGRMTAAIGYWHPLQTEALKVVAEDEKPILHPGNPVTEDIRFALAICAFLHLRLCELTGLLPLGAAAFYVLGLVWLIQPAYLGRSLVHEFGVEAL